MTPSLLLRHLLPLIFTAGLLSLSAAAHSAGRSDHGAAPYPIWSPLSNFEQAALADLPLARTNDPDALLALYLAASGVRSSGDFERVRRRIKAQVSTLQEQAPDDKRQLGALLNTAMHKAFFLEKGDSKAPSGYAADQSRLMGIFETGEFNCISSALLYVVLAREFELDVSGVLLPSHVFVELATPGGPVEVETTSLSGFDQHHDEAFYARQSEQWHQVRGLTPATYEDYLNRRHVSPTHLAAKNMLNQHTSTSQMNQADSARLAEISTYINPDDELAQLKRLYFYNDELKTLSDAKDWPALRRMMEVTYSTATGDALAIGRPDSLAQPVLYYQLGAMLTYAHLAEEEPVLSILSDILDNHPAIPEQEAQIETQIAQTVGVLVRELTEQNRFSDALFVLPFAQTQLPEQETWPDLTRWVYMRWAQYFWQRDEYQEVIDVVDDWLNEPLLAVSDPQAGEILTGAVMQLVNTSIANGEPETAQVWIDQCLTTPMPQACDPAIASLAKEKARLEKDDRPAS